MKDFKDLILCNHYDKELSVHVKADCENGKLTISGQDLGSLIEEQYGDSDYEYWYVFDEKETEKLLTTIKGKDNPEAALLAWFGGTAGCMVLKAICEKNGIRYRYDWYA